MNLKQTYPLVGTIVLMLIMFSSLSGQIIKCPVGLPANHFHEASNQLVQREAICIPTVFHIVYRNPEQDFSDIEVRAQLDALNRDFNLMNENLVNVPEEFRSFWANTGIRFCLAAEAPTGIPTTGITHTLTDQTNVGTAIAAGGLKRIHYTFLGGQDAWPGYLNIWVGEMEGIVGFATFPGEVSQDEDGVIIDPDFFGTIRNQETQRGHTLTHEVGHFLNLLHLWGDNNSSCDLDDQVDDTPQQDGPNFGCPTHPVNSCGSADMFMNFMDFSNDECLAFFTTQQSDRMWSTLQAARHELIDGDIAVHFPIAYNQDDLKNKMIVHYLRDEQKIIVRFIEAIEDELRIELLSIDGKQLRSNTIDGQYTFLIDTETLSSGIYIIRIQRSENEIMRQILIY